MKLRNCHVNGDERCIFPVACPRDSWCRKYKEPINRPVHETLEKWLMGIVSLAMLIELFYPVTQRDWNHYASKFTD